MIDIKMIFGEGDILVGAGILGEKTDETAFTPYVSFDSGTRRYNVGEVVDPAKENSNIKLKMVIRNEKSLDTIIDRLERARELLRCKSKEEASAVIKRRNQEDKEQYLKQS